MMVSLPKDAEITRLRAELTEEIARLESESDSLRATVNDMRALNAQLSADAAARLMEMRDRAEKAEASNAQMQRCLNFFASVIKSGEAWSGTCEQEYRAALATSSGLTGRP